jgi:hypothetical protein
MSIADVNRELLVRYLDTWTPTALHGARRATFALAWRAEPDVGMAEAALRVFAEFTDRLRGRQLTVVLVAPETAPLKKRLETVQAELGTPAELAVHAVAGDPAGKLPAALKAAGAAGAPLLAYLDGTGPVTGGKPGEALVVTETGSWTELRHTLQEKGCTLTAGVELVDGTDSRLVGFGTSSAKSLEAFKNCLWAVDEYAGVRYRDPTDPEGHLMDISLSPHPGPLRRELLAHLDAAGPCSVTELRHFTMTETVYRASDAVRVVTALLSAGAVTREPERGRLGGDVVITPATATRRPPG